MAIQNNKSTLDYLGTIGSDDKGDSLQLSNSAAALVQLAAFIIGEASDNMDREKNVATGDTIRSMKARDIVVNGANFELDIEIKSTYKFLDQGVKGVAGGKGKYQFKNLKVSKRMATAILKWVRKRALRAKGYPSKYGAYHGKLPTRGKGKIETKGLRIKKMVDTASSYKSLAYAVSTNIKKYGIKPTYFMTNAIKAAQSEKKKLFADALKLDIIESINDLN